MKKYLNEEIKQWTEGFVLDGMKYMMPTVPDYPQFHMEGITIELEGGEKIHTGATEKQLVIPIDQSHKRLTFAVHGLTGRKLSTAIQPVTVALYRKGVMLPIYCTQPDITTHVCSGHLSSSRVLPGEYYLYIGNAEPTATCITRLMRCGSGFVYCFQVLEHGIRQVLPEIQSAAVDNELNVHLCFSEPFSIAENRLVCECYDESYRLVAVSTRLTVTKDGMSATLDIQPFGWWLDGTYHLLLYHNHLPKAHFSFSWNNDTVGATVREVLTPESAYFQLYRIVKKTAWGDSFMNLCGCRSIKKQLLRYRSHHLLITARPHFVVSDIGLDRELLTTLFGILYPRCILQTVSCRAYGERIYRHEDVKDIFGKFNTGNIVVLYDLCDLLSSSCESLAELALHHANFMDSVVVLYGTQAELDAVMTCYPAWKPYLTKETCWKQESYTLSERIRIVEQCLAERMLYVSYSARQQLCNLLQAHSVLMQHWQIPEIERWVRDHIVTRQKVRILKNKVFSAEVLRTVEAEDVSFEIFPC